MGFGGLYISISGLQASKYSLNTVSHNISNANNPNYVRQSAMHTNNSYTKSADGRLEMGTGVHVSQIRQIRDEFLDAKVRREMPSFGYHYAKAQILEDVEGVFNEVTNSGLQKTMDGMWNNWNELFKEPESLTMRGLVHESSVAFANSVNHISNQLNDIKQNINKQIYSKVDEVNSTLDQIAKINKSIKVIEGEDVKIRANDYRDERNALIDRLSELLPVSSYENSFGESVISLNGQDLVNGSYISKIDIQADENGQGHIYWKNSNDQIDLKGKGELGGFIDARDVSMTNYMDKLDKLVGTMAERINKLHKGDPAGTPPVPGGIDLEGNPGLDFFVGTGGVITAANIKVNPKLADLNKIAVSKSGGIGDGEIAKEIYGIRDEKLFGDKNLDEFYNDLILTLGLERKEAISSADNQGFLIRSIDEKRKGLSAVSLDEEMADMIKFQHSYSANSRVINALDEMIETIVNRLGIVGR